MTNPQMKTRTRFLGTDPRGSNAGILSIEKVTLEGGLISRFEVGMTEQEIRDLRDLCSKKLKGEG
jgi:hypothetical protein